ncbi:hypothetical protein GCM10017620_16770 [Brevundimonas intermedia]|uniref:Uncharacterized protein n=1 Tax=Brevundimonas intermedia TaxID=74315 RepID=A0ABQ5T9G1_9CAUL|nr:hypothetical protein GCM10017620_16770 [Brevundimonas intermedia]
MGPWDARRQTVRIVRRPDGEAPEWVRDAWIGLVLPLARDDAVTTAGFGVRTLPKGRVMTWWRCVTRQYEVVTGYLVESSEAIRILGETRPEAADWWRSHTPVFTKPGQMFIFDAPACERTS